MSKSSMRERSMYQLGKQDGPCYYPRFPKTKEYMRGYNKTRNKIFKKPKKPLLPRIILFSVAVTIILCIGSLIVWTLY